MNPSTGEARRWFYVREGRRLGPVETGRLVDLVLSGEVSEDALVWHSGLTEWLKARDVEEIRRELPPPVPVVPPPPPPEPAAAPADPGDQAGGREPDGGGAPSSPDVAKGDPPEAPGETSGQRRRRKRKHRHRDSKKRPAWFWPLVVVLVGLMIFLWWLLRRMNEVPSGRIIQTGSLTGQPLAGAASRAPGLPDAYRVALGREPSVSSRVRSFSPRFTTTVTVSPGFFSPSA